jgi:hypothetical protein
MLVHRTDGAREVVQFSFKALHAPAHSSRWSELVVTAERRIIGGIEEVLDVVKREEKRAIEVYMLHAIVAAGCQQEQKEEMERAHEW